MGFMLVVRVLLPLTILLLLGTLLQEREVFRG